MDGSFPVYHMERIAPLIFVKGHVLRMGLVHHSLPATCMPKYFLSIRYCHDGFCIYLILNLKLV